jgi:hypothetical protein
MTEESPVMVICDNAPNCENIFCQHKIPHITMTSYRTGCNGTHCYFKAIGVNCVPVK